MAIDNANFVVTREVAERTGDISNIYMTADGRYVIDARLLSRIRLTSQEYLTGLEDIEMVSREEALTLIARGGYRTGPSVTGDAAAEAVQEDGAGSSSDSSSEVLDAGDSSSEPQDDSSGSEAQAEDVTWDDEGDSGSLSEDTANEKEEEE